LADISLFYQAYETLVPRGMAKFMLAYVGNEPAAVSIDLLYKDVIYGWFGGMDRKFMAHVPNEMLMWNILKWGCNHGYRVYDFGGAGKPDEQYGVRDFKAKFGGDLVCFGRNTWESRPALLAVSKLAYSILKRILF
jgi:lipid II:glycine glycyltransferase (peptidoglycan interpeptide bridge formation enzyme)